MTVCGFCKKPVNPRGRNVWQYVMGFEKVRLAGEGVHPMKARTYSERFVHGTCLENHLHGGQQESLAL